jgi:protein TonB
MYPKQKIKKSYLTLKITDMETKKSPKVNLEKKRFLFLELGLVLTLSICFAAFEWTTSESTDASLGNLDKTELLDEEITSIKLPEPPPPPPAPPISKSPEVLVIVDKPVIQDPDIFITDPTKTVDPKIRIVTPDVVAPTEEDEVIPFVKVETKPMFPGGDKELLLFIKKNSVYPEIPKDLGVEGRVFVQFVIDTKGDVTSVSIAKGVDPYLDAEAMRVVSLIPDWSPGKQRGKLVSVSYIIPINFVLD